MSDVEGNVVFRDSSHYEEETERRLLWVGQRDDQ
jgi:hypothetical protein